MKPYKNYLRVSEAARTLRVTPQTIRNYAKQGKLTPYKTPGGQTVYDEKEIYNILHQTNHEEQQTRTAFYVRASDGDPIKLAEQEKQLLQKYGKPFATYKDKASGLNEKRKGLNKLIKDIKLGIITRVIVTQKDRLTRFGYSYLEELFNAYDCEIIAAFETPDKTLQEELLQDFMNLIASFSGKYYRLRGYEQKTQLLKTAKQRLDETKENKTE